jgi:hypothetical protein
LPAFAAVALGLVVLAIAPPVIANTSAITATTV